MTLTEVDDMSFIVHVQTTKPATMGDWQEIFDELDRAMDEVEAKLPDDDIVSFQIRLSVDGFDPIGSEVGDEYFLGKYDPTDHYSPVFWRLALSDPASRQLVERWVSRYAATLKRPEISSMRMGESLWEDDNTQFGEPLMSMLAWLDVAFVAHYIQFLDLWDLEHQVYVKPTIDALIEHHIGRPEIAALETHARVRRYFGP